MTLLGSPQPATDSLVPRFVAAGVAIVVMLGATVLFLAGLVVFGTGGDPNAGLTYQLGLMWSLFATIGAVAGSVLLAKKWEYRRGPWKAAAYGTLAGVGAGLAGDVVALVILMGIYRFAGA